MQLADIVMAKMMQFKYTMDGLIVHDVRNMNGNVHFRVVGSLLRSNLVNLHSGIHKTVVETFTAELVSKGKAINGKIPSHDKSWMRTVTEDQKDGPAFAHSLWLRTSFELPTAWYSSVRL